MAAPDFSARPTTIDPKTGRPVETNRNPYPVAMSGAAPTPMPAPGTPPTPPPTTPTQPTAPRPGQTAYNSTAAENALGNYNWSGVANANLQNSGNNYSFGGSQAGMGAYGGTQGMFDPRNPGTSSQTLQQINNASQQQGLNNVGGAVLGSGQIYPVPAGTPGAFQITGDGPWFSAYGQNPAGAGTGGGSGGGNGSGGGTGANGGLGQVTSTIDGQSDIYSNDLIQRLTNRAVADARTNADPRYQMKKFGRPGLSMDEGTLSAAMPGIAQSNQDAFNAMGQIPYNAQMANANYRLQGQQAAGNEALALAGLLQGNQQLGDYENNANLGMQASMIPQLLQLLG